MVKLVKVVGRSNEMDHIEGNLKALLKAEKVKLQAHAKEKNKVLRRLSIHNKELEKVKAKAKK